MTTELRVILKQLERDISNFAKRGFAGRTGNYLSGRLSLLEKTMDNATTRFEVAAKEFDATQTDELEEIIDRIRECYFDYRSDLLDAMDKLKASETHGENNQSDQSSRKVDIRLPKINLPVFSGSYESWRTFRDLFVSLIHHNTALSEIERMHYLKTSVSGEAEKLLAHLGIDNGNYCKAWTILTNRYDHQRFLVNTQLKCLFNQPSISQERSETIKELLDTSMEVVHSLENLQVPVQHWDAVLIFILLQKLPTRTQHLWEEKLGSKQNSKDLPTFAEFTQFLETRFRSLEAVNQQQARIQPTSPRNVPKRNTFHAATNSMKFTCKLCNRGPHSIRKCGRFLKMGTAERCQNVSKLGICRNCLSYNHTADQCSSSYRCYYCGQLHHSLLHSTPAASPHPSASQGTTSVVNPSRGRSQNYLTSAMDATASTFQPHYGTQPTNSSAVNTFHSMPNTATQVLLATALVKVKTSSGETLSLRALLDTGSQASFITESAVQLLNLRAKSTHVEVSGLGLVSSGTCQRVVEITFASHHSTFKTSTQAFVFKSLSGHLPARSLPTLHWECLSGLVLADPLFYQPAKVDLLLGSDVLAEIFLPELIRPAETNMPVLQKTKLGWILFGKAPVQSESIKSFHQIADMDTQLQKFWEQEEAPFQTHETSEHAACEQHFVKNVRHTHDGRYEVALPFKGGSHPILGRSQEGAMQRFRSLERRLISNPQLRDEYSACLEEYSSLGHMSEIEHDRLQDLYHYFLPHHAVIKETSSTTRLRIVFDASFKTSNGVSLNDQLMIGPSLQHNVTDIILRWRLFQFTFTADIEKMYRQIWVTDQDSYYQLIIWRKDPSEPIKIYRLKTVTFGTAAAPYLAIRTLKKLAEESSCQHPLASMMINQEMYVDDLISGADTIEEAKAKINDIQSTLQSAGFNLRKWTSNRKELLQGISSQNCEASFLVPGEGLDQIKTLGIHWLPVDDVFSYRYVPSTSPQPTKRFILSTIARLFDPLGWISPCTVKAKCLMQLLWVRRKSWDETIDDDTLKEWNSFYNELQAVNNIHLPRWVQAIGTLRQMELHGFSDASEKAYGATVYLRVQDDEGNVHMNLLIAKSKVAPVKPVSLPRLELCGAVLLSKLLHYVVQVLRRNDIKVYAWTDSTITLSWIFASPSKWETFVRNRVGEIQRLTNVTMWKHIPTQENPADLVSRGMLPSALAKSSIWWNGPAFLRRSWIFEFPKQPTDFNTEEDFEIIQVHHVGVTDCRIIFHSIHLIHRMSNYKRLTRTTAYCLRFIKNLRRGAIRSFGPLNTTELDTATRILARCAQQEMFPNGIEKGRGMISLCPFIDGEGILRVGGRLQNANLTFDLQHPIILEPRHHLTTLIIRNAHEKTLHGGIQLMMAYTRTRYWILQAKRSIKKMLNSCVICHRHRKKTVHQLMGNLPTPRITMSRPFSHVGIDYAGPITIRAWKGRGAKTFKAYLAIFICLATKAIHLEAVTDLTTQAFLAALRRFGARRGICGQIYSDCGRNFVGAEAELHRLMKGAGHDWKEVAEVLATQGTMWNFIPPASPHFGGLWEAGVKSVKHHLKRVISNATLTYEELSTLLTQIEACLNSRPLCPLSENPDDFQALTPAHFLIGEAIFTVPEPNLSIHKQSLTDRWKMVQLHLQTFWKQWQQEYLTRLQQRPKWLKPQPQLEVNDLVLIRDDNLPPAKWKLGRIIQTYPGTDNITRVVKLLTDKGECKRPITKLSPLPINKNNTQDKE